MNKSTILYKTLARALSMMRPHNSEGTRRLTDWLEERAHKLPNAMIGRDGAGNLHVDTRLNSSNRTLFVAHVDTVHRKEGPNKIKQTSTHWYADGAALGADDGAGVAMLMHLMYAGVPAYYIFTQGCSMRSAQSPSCSPARCATRVLVLRSFAFSFVTFKLNALTPCVLEYPVALREQVFFQVHLIPYTLAHKLVRQFNVQSHLLSPWLSNSSRHVPQKWLGGGTVGLTPDRIRQSFISPLVCKLELSGREFAL